jgi:hypothetical protein
MLWKENVASNNSSSDSQSESTKPTIRDAVKVVKSDPKIMLVGAIQSLFESAMVRNTLSIALNFNCISNTSNIAFPIQSISSF